MGSWANSLHVRHENATVVQNAIRLLLVGQGYREQVVEQHKLRSVAALAEGSDEGAQLDDGAPAFAGEDGGEFFPSEGLLGEFLDIIGLPRFCQQPSYHGKNLY
jgi:hypothetical protein